MPIYEFHCEKCGQDFEALVFNHNQADQVRCENCGAEKVTRKVSRVGSCGSAGLSSGGSVSGCGGSGFS